MLCSTRSTPCFSRYSFARAAAKCFFEPSTRGSGSCCSDAVKLALKGDPAISRLGISSCSCLTVPPRALMPATLTCAVPTFLSTSTV